MSDLPWIPQFVVEYIDTSFPYETIGKTDRYIFSYPVTRWLPGQRTVGTTAKDTLGSPGTTVQLRRYLIGLNLRFHEAEWSMVRDFIIQVQGRKQFTWEPHGIAGTPESLTVRLESPRVSDILHPTRDASYPKVMLLPIVVGSDTAFDLSYFPAE